jgi:type III restriction enzyme
MDANPILNSPYEEPKLHYYTNEKGEIDYSQIIKGRRVFIPDLNAMPTRQGPQGEIFAVNDLAGDYGSHLVNLIRKEVGAWRASGYPNTTRVTKELLNFWFNNPERHAVKKLFFAQRESVETAIWLNEVAERSNAGQHIQNLLRIEQKAVSSEYHQQLPRIAFKMATGTGKTVVMATLIVYHFFNRQEYRQDTRFADYFLVVTPGITIKDRLGVLFVDKKSQNKNEREDYYAIRDIVPRNLEPYLANLNSKLVITNYHSFEARTLQGNKRSPMDGKIIGYDADGNAIKQEAKEEFNHVVKRVMGNFKTGSRLLVLNDEAHHCYLPKQKGRTKDTEGDENAKAAVWFTGISELSHKFKLAAVYDLSATPYYLQGSGYTPYSLFGWVVSDFGLTEAIEAGLVKIPYLPESDTTQELTMPILRNLYEHVKQELPKKGQRTRKKEAKEGGEQLSEEPPKLPRLVKGALDQFYTHYKAYADNLRMKGEESTNLFSRPPVFIVVCNNTSVSKEVYKFIAGYEYKRVLKTDKQGNPVETESLVVPGIYSLFSNYDETGRLKAKSPTLIIDSEALDDGGQVDDDFKEIFQSEIEEFRRDYARLHGQGSAGKITDAEILREVVNTVGQPGKMGGHIRCVVSVSMLTEGWDANTVTHIMGLRAFGSQLLCEQVAGRALRRMSYFLQGYDKDGNPTSDKRKIVIEKFPPEYAHIIGVPFKMFKGGEASLLDPPDYKHVRAIPDRQKDLEIEFPNLEGYRVEFGEDELLFDFTDVENYEIDGSKFPLATTMQTAFSVEKETLEVSQVLELREQEILYRITKELIHYHFSDDDGNAQFQKFSQLKDIVQYWYVNRVVLLNITDSEYKKLLYFEDPKTIADHINRGINPHINTSEFIKPVFNYYNKFGSTKHVSGNTSKEVFATQKSHVNFVVKDSGWEEICARTLEELDVVTSYVKNDFMGFAIPYVKEGKDKLYYTDFIARVVRADGSMANLMIEVTGLNTDKAEKKWYVENRWIPAVNAVKDKYGYDEWHFIEIANDIRNIKNQLLEKIRTL